MKNFFDLDNMSEREAEVLNPQVLAFVGDAVYTLYVKNLIALESKEKSGALHKKASAIVKAKAQSETIERLMPMFTEKEQDIFRRGRNYKTQSTAKNSTPQEYHRATGFEAVIGYLYLSGQKYRLQEILKLSIKE